MLYAAVCLQMTGDSVRCNFGAKPFDFDVDTHFLSKRYSEQFLEVKQKPVRLPTMYSMVRQYLEAMAYSETLAVFKAEQGIHIDPQLCRGADEETKVVQRKMTIDYGSNEKPAEEEKTDEGKLSQNKGELQGSKDAESRSQLTVETEKMEPLPSVDLLAARSSSILSSQQKDVLTGESLENTAAPAD